ncbi:translocation/assembly module TamB domain-containing protein [Kordia sp.]|uniref:translocation/assembly module TamB domain-containing protein n=1 Tax=Kordia sp. TaxID=1965332 RepID=UPI003D27B20C
MFWKIVKRTILVILILFVSLILCIRSQWGQDIIVTEITDYISNKTNTKVEIKKFYVTFSGNLLLEGLYLEDKKGDTLVYSENIEASIALMPLIRGNAFHLKWLESEGLKANISRKDSISKFNYDFLLDAFATQDTTTQTTEEALKIKLGALNFKDIDVTYNDAVLGIESAMKLNTLNLEAKDVDIVKMRFDVKNAIVADGTIKYNQTKAFPVVAAEEATKLPFISIQNLDVKKTEIAYTSAPEYLELDLTIDELRTQVPTLDLEKQIIGVGDLNLKNSIIKFQQLAPTVGSTNFEWPEWTITADKVELVNNEISAKTGRTILVRNVFNAENIQFKNVDLKANSVAYKPGNASASVENLSFIDRSGFQIKNLATQLQLDNTSTTLKNLSVRTNNSSINGALTVDYTSINDLIQNPNLSRISLTLPSLNINPKDAYFFSPELKNNTYITAFSKKQLTGSLQLNGTLNDLNIPNTDLTWGENTKINLQGSIKNALDIDNLTVDFKNFNLVSNKKDAFNFIDPALVTVQVPEKFQLKGTLNGGLTNLKTNATLKTSDGNIVLKGNFKNNKKIAFNGTFNVDNLALGKILSNEKLGVYSFTTTVNGEGNSLNTLDATLATDFKKLSYNGYDFSELNLDGKITNGNGNLNLQFKDKNLDFEMVNTVELDTVASKIHTVLDVKGVNFQTLKLAEEDVRAKLKLEADIVGNSTENLRFNGTITDALSVRNNRPYLLGKIMFNGKLTDKTTAFDIDSNPIKASLVSNTGILNLIDELQQQFDNYFKENITASESVTVSNTTMKFDATVKQAPILKDLFLPKLESLNPIEITVDFSAENNSLTAIAKAPQITYNGNTLDSLDFSLNAEKQALDFDFELGTLKTGALEIQKIRLDGNLKDKILYTNFIAKDSSETLIQIASEITREKDSTNFHINPEGLILNKQNWVILPNNKITFAFDYLGFNDFELSQGEQQITVSSTLPRETLPHIGFNFKNFKLSTITSIFNQEKLLASGKLNGEFIAENPFGDLGILAKANITNLEVLEVPLGTLNLDAKSLNRSKYDLNLDVTGKNLNLSIIGDYTANENGAPLNFDIDLKNLELKAIEEFSSKYISKTAGNISGDFKLSGTTNVPTLLGALKFNNATLTVNAFNAAFTLPKESIKIDEAGIYFDKFTMLDTNQNPFVLDGDISTKTLTNPSFALTLKAKNIEVLNSTEEANDLFYGKVNLDADVSVDGTLQHPKVRGSLMINETSDFTYVIPEDEVNLVEKEGIVIFVNKKNPDDILTNQRDVSSKAILRGYDIDAKLSISNKAVFNIIVDERTGDNLKVSGTGDFNFGISENGDMSLSGKYEVTSGHYEVSLYNLVRRHFDIAPGSSIVWRGNPLEADMDIRAIYKVETAASGLMASQLTGESASVTSKYRQKLPFLVYLNLEGQLLKPEISFNLDIPRDNQGELGGAVYAQVQQLNTREDELNKQVFSLLVLNQFFPSATNDGSSGGSLSIARDNANNVLSNQLNNFSNKLFGKSGIEVDFGLSSYTDYQGNSATDRTQLDISARKRLLNDRLIVEVGSGVDIQENSQNAGQTTPLVGTVNIQYLFDDNGRWRLKAYRRNDFENVIDGQVILTGISLIFNQEFNKFEELFAKAVKEEVAKTKEDEKTKKDKPKE